MSNPDVEPFHGRRWALFGTTIASLILAGCTRTPFERQHDEAIRENPYGVTLEIRTRGNRKQFAVSEAVAIANLAGLVRSEPIEFEEVYTAKVSGMWHIEVLDGWNDASLSRAIYVTDGKQLLHPPQPLYGIICCDSRHVWLNPDTLRLPYKTSAVEGMTMPKEMRWYKLYLPAQPGKYQVYVTTRRVYRYTDSMATYHGQGLPTSSNILELELK